MAVIEEPLPEVAFFSASFAKFKYTGTACRAVVLMMRDAVMPEYSVGSGISTAPYVT